MIRFVAVLSVSILVLMLAACTAPAVREPERHVIRLAGGMPGGGSLAFAESLAAAYRRALPNVEVTATPTGGSLAVVEALQAGTVDVGFTFANLAYLALAGRTGPAPYDQLRAIAVLQVSPAYLVVRPDSDIDDVADLRGRRVATAAGGGGSPVTVELILNAYGMSVADLQLSTFRTEDASRRLLARSMRCS